jgi:H+/Cl- antiporter ClcA
MLEALRHLISPHQINVLAVMGLSIGYICIFLVKILDLTNIYLGVIGVGLTTLILLFLDKAKDFRSTDWWCRSFLVVLFSLFLTAPQLYYAWWTSVQERQKLANADGVLQALEKTARQVPPEITIVNPQGLK